MSASATPKFCAADGEWPRTTAGTQGSIPCSGNAIGKQYRTCHRGGIWGDDVDRRDCSSNTCSTADGFPRTKVGSWGRKPCDPGYEGTVLRFCRMAQDKQPAWGRTDRRCTTVAYPPSAEEDLEDVIREDEEGQGRAQVTGTQGPSPAAYCPTDGPWDRTQAGTTAKRPCSVEGNPASGQYVKRHCNLDGTWGAVEPCGAEEAEAMPNARATALSPDAGIDFRAEEMAAARRNGAQAANPTASPSTEDVAPRPRVVDPMAVALLVAVLGGGAWVWIRQRGGLPLVPQMSLPRLQ